MIAEYEDPQRNQELDSPRQYGMGQKHKHLPEMQKVCGLAFAPISTRSCLIIIAECV